MFARCPVCQTVFRVRPEQLRAHGGKVRCGHCLNAFDASSNLLDEAGPAAIPAPSVELPGAKIASPTAPLSLHEPQAPDPSEPTEERAPAEAEKRTTVDLDLTELTSARPPVPEEHFFVLEERAPEPEPELHTSAADELDFDIPDRLLPSRQSKPSSPLPAEPVLRPTFSVEFAPTFEPIEFIEPPPPNPAAPLETRPQEDQSPPQFTEPAGESEHPTETAPPLRAWEHEPTGRIEPRVQAPEAPVAAATESRPFQAPAADEEFAPEPQLADDDYAPRGPSQASRWLLGLGMGVLAGTLVVQSAYIFRDELARDWPVLRPALVSACKRLDCTISLPQVASEVSVDASDLQSEPSRPGRYVLSATVRNRAKYAQAYPHLELTLTDARDRALARRVLTPQDWAPEADLEQGLAAGREITINLPFEAAGLNAAGYRIYVFYP